MPYNHLPPHPYFDPIKFWFYELSFYPSTLHRFASIRRVPPIVLYLCASTDYATRANKAQKENKTYKIKYFTPAVGWRSRSDYWGYKDWGFFNTFDIAP